jgi:hypothetical protein
MIYVTTTALWLLFDNDHGFKVESSRTRLFSVVAVVFDVLFTWT